MSRGHNDAHTHAHTQITKAERQENSECVQCMINIAQWPVQEVWLFALILSAAAFGEINNLVSADTKTLFIGSMGHLKMF